jgi:dolichyl-diphosphooligosaccharide--protein glycosyltransferase
MPPKTKRPTRRGRRPAEAPPSTAKAETPVGKLTLPPRWVSLWLPVVLAAACVAVVVWVRVLPHHILSIKPTPANASRVAALVEAESYLAEDGQRYVYLDEFDSYVFLRAARSILRTGSPCDVVVAGECRDTLTLAPFGARMLYGDNLHVRAIVALHRLLAWWHPGWPLPESSFYVSVLMGGFGALVAFFLGWRLGGPAGAVAASLLMSVQRLVLERSLGGDNDIWNLVFPLLMVTLLVEALRQTNRAAQVALAAAAALVCGLQAWAWRGWPFAWTVACAGLGTTALWRTVRWYLHRRASDPALPRRAVDGWLVAAAFVLLAWAGLAMAGASVSVLGVPHGTEAASDRPVAATGDGTARFPSVLATVRELDPFSLAQAAEATGGWGLFLLGVMGGILAALPVRPSMRHLVVSALGLVLWLALARAAAVPRWLALAAIIVPVAFLLVDRLQDASEEDAGPALFVSIWLVAGLYATLSATRFALLVAAPIGAGLAVTCHWLDRAMQTLPGRLRLARGRWSRPWFQWATLLVVSGLILAGPLRTGQAAVRSRLPRFNAVWEHALTRIRNASPPDAIVHTWWDYGYWVKYFAERRVTGDGGTLLTHAHHWFARALLAQTADQAMGMLRMLDCGGDALPNIEGKGGGFGLLERGLGNGLDAYDTLVKMVALDREGARRVLGERGIAGGDADRILAATHCEPPEAYLVLTSRQAARLAWLPVGRWDVHKAFAFDSIQAHPDGDAVASLMTKLGIDRPAASELERGARAAIAGDDQEAVRKYVSGENGLLAESWLPCEPARGGEATRVVVCTPTSPTPPIEGVEIDTRTGTVELRVTGHGRGQPSSVMVIEGSEMKETIVEKPRFAGLSVLVDRAHGRVLLGTDVLMRSVFVRLLYLGGAGLTHFEKFDEGRVWSGERVLAYKVKW